MSGETQKCECGECRKCDPITPADIADELRQTDADWERLHRYDDCDDDAPERPDFSDEGEE